MSNNVDLFGRNIFTILTPGFSYTHPVSVCRLLFHCTLALGGEDGGGPGAR